MATRHHPVLRLLVCLVALAGCGDAFSGGEEQALAEARARWDAANLFAYRVEVRVSCFCPEALPVFTRIEVRGDSVVSAEQVDSVTFPTDIPLEAWPTVLDGFELIEGAAHQDYDEIEAQYDPIVGYPLRIELVCRPDELDCGAHYEFRNLQPADPHSSAGS